MDRKEFLRALLGMAGGLLAPLGCTSPGRSLQDAPSPRRPGSLPRRRLGASGPEVTVLGLGGYHLGLVREKSESTARAIVETALDEGIEFFDTAESYQDGRSEEVLGAALGSARSRVFLMSKTYSLDDRSAASARRHLEGSLERLRTDHLDLWQLHSVRSVEDVDRAFAAGGAMEAILEAKAQGTVGLVGVTGHLDPAAHRRALEYWDRGLRFDCMQLPLNPIDFHQKSFQHAALPGLVERGIGVIAMKTAAYGALPEKGVCSIDECQRFVWSLPVSVAVVGMESPEQVRENCRRARRFQPLDAEQADALLERIRPQADLPLEWYKNP